MKIEDVTDSQWQFFFTNFNIETKELIKKFPFVANYEEVRSLLRDPINRPMNGYNNRFYAIIWKLPQKMTNMEKTLLFQEFLLEDNHQEYEDIISYLQSPLNDDDRTAHILEERLKTLPSFYKTDDDIKYPFIRKIIYAIGAQPEPYNLQALERIVTETSDGDIKKMAQHQLDKRKRLG